MAGRSEHPIETAIALGGVAKSFGAHVAVADLTLDVARGELVALVGKTGAGKSTVLHLIMGTFPADAGTVRVSGLDPYRDAASLGGALAVSFQTDRLLPWRTALENVAFGLQIRGVGRAERERRAREWLARVKMAAAADKYPHELSGGMRQRVSFARALAIEPSVLLLDESFSQLDEVTSRELRADFAELVRALGTTTVLVTHRIEEALELADRVIVLGVPARTLADVRITADDRRDRQRLVELRGLVRERMEGEAAPRVLQG